MKNRTIYFYNHPVFCNLQISHITIEGIIGKNKNSMIIYIIKLQVVF